MKSLRSTTAQHGFTIVELMIATAVFSVVLLLCAYGLLEIGRTYYKGAATSRTQEVARRIIDDVSESIKFNGSDVFGTEATGWYCIGTKRYSFVLGRQFTNASTHGLVSDTPATSCTAGTGAQNINGTLTASSRELLGPRMRLARLAVTPVSGATGLYNITVRVVTGDDDLIIDRNGSGGAPTSADNPLDCKDDRAGSQFCAVSELSTTVQRRL